MALYAPEARIGPGPMKYGPWFPLQHGVIWSFRVRARSSDMPRVDVPPAVVIPHDHAANGWAADWSSSNVASACGGPRDQSLTSFAAPLVLTWTLTRPRVQPGHPSRSTPSSVVRL